MTDPSNIRHLKDLTPDAHNRRKHNPRNIGMLVDALHKVGAARSIVIDEAGEVLAGNGVVEAAAEAGLTKVQVVDADGETIVAVRRSGLTAEQKTALAIYDNRTAELAEWNPEQLRADQADGLDLKPYFSEDELAEIVGTEVKAGLTDPDAVPDLRQTDIVRGDLFQLGQHRLLCGDSTSAEDVARVMGGEKAAGCVTDPPYGVDFEYESCDDSDPAKNDALIASVFALCPKPLIYTAGTVNLLRELSRWKGRRLKVLAWSKKFAMTRNGLGGFHTWEPVFVVDPDTKYAHLEKSLIEEMTDREPGLLGGHPCPKPVGLWKHLYDALIPGDAYEPFSGSGTAIIACEQLNRRCYAIEIEPAYVQVAIDRWEAFTGQKAAKL